MVPLATSPHHSMISKSYFINISPFLVERDLCVFKAISGTEDKKPNIMTKDGPVSFIIKEIPRVLETVSQELWIKTK